MNDPMSFFSENVDRWGAAEWFDRLAKAIRAQDEAVLAMHRASDDDECIHEARFETFKSIAASSAMTLVRDFEADVRAALLPTPAPSLSGIVKPLEWAKYRNGDADADTPFGEIYTAYAGGAWRITRGMKAGKFVQAGEDLEAAKAGAQADYERRVMSCLVAREGASDV